MKYPRTSSTTEASVREIVSRIDGWLTPAQAAILAELAARIPDGSHIVEFGSFLGRSTLSLLSGAPEVTSLYAVDPFAGDEVGPRPAKSTGVRIDSEAVHRQFHRNLAFADAEGRVTHLRMRSAGTPAEVLATAGLFFVDGSHRFRDATADLRLVCRHLRPGGWLAIHDAFYSVEVTLAIMIVLVRRPDFVYRGRSGSLAVYQRTGPAPGRGVRTGGANQLVQLAELVTLCGVCVRKSWLLMTTATGRVSDIGARWPH
ncbi:class I SAM-dependent methyltransferase [Streptomyces sp. NPDC101151]|uniref:class I SAM-dependent methyltransferase n=1 Tax=Streptomyces sp. NPDC101151 TaxID=3366115 RepID=UPI003805387C